MDFVVTEHFLHTLSYQEREIEICRIFNLFIGKKCSYIVENYRYHDYKTDVFSEILYILNLIHDVPETNTNFSIYPPDDAIFLNSATNYIKKEIVFDQDCNIIEIYDISDNLIYEATYISNKLIHTIEIRPCDISSSNNVNVITGFFEANYFYDDFGTLYKKIRIGGVFSILSGIEKSDTNTYKINKEKNNTSLESTSVDTYDINGIIKTSIKIYLKVYTEHSGNVINFYTDLYEKYYNLCYSNGKIEEVQFINYSSDSERLFEKLNIKETTYKSDGLPSYYISKSGININDKKKLYVYEFDDVCGKFNISWISFQHIPTGRAVTYANMLLSMTKPIQLIQLTHKISNEYHYLDNFSRTIFNLPLLNTEEIDIDPITKQIKSIVFFSDRGIRFNINDGELISITSTVNDAVLFEK